MNFVINEVLKMWILSKMRFWKCDFSDKLRIFAPVFSAFYEKHLGDFTQGLPSLFICSMGLVLMMFETFSSLMLSTLMSLFLSPSDFSFSGDPGVLVPLESSLEFLLAAELCVILSVLRNLARRFWNQTWEEKKLYSLRCCHKCWIGLKCRAGRSMMRAIMRVNTPKNLCRRRTHVRKNCHLIQIPPLLDYPHFCLSWIHDYFWSNTIVWQ